VSKRFDTITLEEVATYPRPGAGVPGRVGFTPDSSAVTWLHSAEGSLVRSLWAVDVANGERRELAAAPPEARGERGLSPEEVLRRERARLRETGVTAYEFARDAEPPVLLVPIGGRAFVRIGDGPLTEVLGAAGAVDAHLSRDGRRLGFVRGDEVHVADLGDDPAAADVRRLTDTAAPGLTNGVADFVAHEELGRSRGWWLSRDGERVAYVEADSRRVPEYPIAHQGEPELRVEVHRYPFAGAENPKVRLGVVSARGGETTWMDLGPADEERYLARVAWRPDGRLAALVVTRDQTRQRWLVLDPDTGRAETLLEESGEPWLNLDHMTRFLDSGELLRASERTGFRHLDLHAADGARVRQLTSGEWMVTALCDVDEERRVAYFQATEADPRERHVYAVGLDGGDLRRLTKEPGWHAAAFAPDHDRFVDVWSSLARAPRLTLRRVSDPAEGRVLHDEGVTAEGLGLKPPAPFEVKAADGTPLYGLLYEPPGAAEKAPLIVSVYGGPHAQMVRDEWTLTVDRRAQHLARQGYLVMKLDNRGAANRGLAFEAHLARRFGTVEVEDQLAGVRALAESWRIDPARVGVYGWSYGGYMALLCLMKQPDAFKVGVSGAPVTFWEGYDTIYTERYMGLPAENPAGYREASVLEHAAGLRGDLLVVHGMMDENVHFRHTARLLVALEQADRHCDLLVLPRERHMPRDAAGLLRLERRIFEYLRDKL